MKYNHIIVIRYHSSTVMQYHRYSGSNLEVVKSKFYYPVNGEVNIHK